MKAEPLPDGRVMLVLESGVELFITETRRGLRLHAPQIGRTLTPRSANDFTTELVVGDRFAEGDDDA